MTGTSRRMRWAWLAAAWLVAGQAAAKEVLIDAAPMHDKKIRIDGMLREWPELLVLSERLSGAPKNDDPRALGVAGYDDDALYVAMRVKDGTFVHGQDYAELRLAFPVSGGHKSYSVRLRPGEPGKTAGTVELGGKKVAGSSLVEAPATGGFTLEAKIPWRAFPQAATTRTGLRGALTYRDSDEGTAVVIGTSTRQGGQMPPLTIQSEYALNQALVLAKGLDPRPHREAVGNVVGDAMKERVAVFDRYLTVTGWNYRKGTEFYYHDLQVRSPKQLKRLTLQDFTGDGRDELVVQRETGTASDGRELLEVWQFQAADGPPVLVFQHEVGLFAGDNRVDNQVVLEKHRGKPAITIRVAEGKVDPDTWNATPAGGDTLPVLLPWHETQSRSYAWDGKSFNLVDEKTGKAKSKPPKAKGTKFWSGKGPPPGHEAGGRGASSTASGSDEVSPGGNAPRPRPPTAEELMDQVYGLYRSERGMKKLDPRFDFVTDVAADPTLERVVVHGKDIVVFGKKFREGRSYAYTTIGVDKPEDVLQVTAQDVSGDGRAEIIVRGVIRAQASKKLGGDVVTRHALFIYRVLESGIERIFAAETGRSVGDDMVVGTVRFLPAGAALNIELRPGHAVGWNEKTYPFPEDRHPYAGLEPLLLPWSDAEPRRYHYAGGKYVRDE